MNPALPSRLALVAVVSLAALACFDVSKVPIPRFTIDDFDDGDLEPPSDKFEAWTCQAVSNADTDASAVTCTVGPVGDDHASAMSLRFALEDPADGERQLGRAELAIRSAGLDLTGFRQLVLSAILESGSPPLPPGTQFRVEIGCSGLNGPRALEQLVPGVVIDADWATFRLDLADFAPLEPACLREPDVIRFSVRPGLPDGEPTRGALHVDDVYLQ